MWSDDPRRRSAEVLGAYFMGDVTITDALSRICYAVLEVEPAATMVGISLTVEDRIETCACTHPDVEIIEAVQHHTGDGPGIDAVRTGHPVLIASTAATGPYLRFRAAAAGHGLRAVLAIPLHAGGHVTGVLNLYATESGAFSAQTTDHLHELTTRAAWQLVNHRAYWDALTLSRNLQQTMDSRAVIEQAKGIIMAMTGCNPDEAFQHLRERAQQEKVQVRDVASDIVGQAQRSNRP